MDILWTIGIFVFSILGIIGCIVPMIPGTAFSYAGLICAYLCSSATLSGWSMLIWLAVSLVTIAADYYLPAVMARRFGGSKAGAIGATVGVFFGFFLMSPFLGVILGPFFGAVIGELVHDKSDPAKALVVGFGSFASFIVGTGLKLIVSLAMMVYAIAHVTLW